MFRFLTILFSAALALAAADDLDTQIKRVIDAFAIVEQNAATPVSSEQGFYQGAIPGLLRKLDPHSVFFDPGQFDQLRKMESSTQKGFGTIVSLLPGRVIVLQTLPGTPSAKAGLAAGDGTKVDGDRVDMGAASLLMLMGVTYKAESCQISP